MSITKAEMSQVCEKFSSASLSHIQHIFKTDQKGKSKLPLTELRTVMASKVFHIPELFELILLSTVTQTDLFVLQRVNKTFHTVIRDSPKIQQKIFGPPPPTRFTLWEEDSEDADEEISTLYAHFPPMKSLCGNSDDRSFTNDHFNLGPFSIHSIRLEDRRIYIDAYFGYHVKSEDQMGWMGKSKAVYRNGLWRRLALGMAESEIAVVVEPVFRLGGLGLKDEVRYLPKRATLGDLFDALKELRGVVEYQQSLDLVGYGLWR